MPWSMSTIIDQGIHQGKNKVTRNEKRKKQLWVFVYIKYGKFWSVSLELFIKQKPPFSEECCYFTKKLLIKTKSPESSSNIEICQKTMPVNYIGRVKIKG